MSDNQAPNALARFWRDARAWGRRGNRFSLFHGMRAAWAWWSYSETLEARRRWGWRR